MRHDAIGKNIVFILTLLTIIISWGQSCCSKWVPSSAAAVLLGMIATFFWDTGDDQAFVFASEMFFYMMLPPILLHSAFQFRMTSLRRTWLSSIVFAWVGTLLTVFMIAWGIIVWSSGTNMPFGVLDALLFASILAPTDTVATISLGNAIRSRSGRSHDNFIVEVLENESVMNDALSIVFVRLFSNMVENDTVMNRWVPIEAIGMSILYSFMAIAAGFVFAKIMNVVRISTMSLHFLFALQLYAFCEYIGVSGILCIFVYGSCVDAPPEMVASVESLSTIMESYVYLTLGLALQNYDVTMWYLSFGILLACLIGRVVVVFFLGGMLRCCGEKHWDIRSLLFFSMCGVRGAISFALSMSLQTRYAKFAQSTAFVVIMSTILCVGGMQKCVRSVLLREEQRFITTV